MHFPPSTIVAVAALLRVAEGLPHVDRRQLTLTIDNGVIPPQQTGPPRQFGKRQDDGGDISGDGASGAAAGRKGRRPGLSIELPGLPLPIVPAPAPPAQSAPANKRRQDDGGENGGLAAGADAAGGKKKRPGPTIEISPPSLPIPALPAPAPAQPSASAPPANARRQDESFGGGIDAIGGRRKPKPNPPSSGNNPSKPPTIEISPPEIPLPVVPVPAPAAPTESAPPARRF